MVLVLKVKGKSYLLERNGQFNQRSCYKNDFTTVFFDGVDWIILGVAKSINSDALHPASVRDDEWQPQLVSITFAGVSSRSAPISLEQDLGVDFFFRSKVHRLRKPIWYTSPSGRLTHSGAKRHENVLGTRWCHLCRIDVSSNNFVSQHMKRVHNSKSLDEWHLFCKFVASKSQKNCCHLSMQSRN